MTQEIPPTLEDYRQYRVANQILAELRRVLKVNTDDRIVSALEQLIADLEAERANPRGRITDRPHNPVMILEDG